MNSLDEVPFKIPTGSLEGTLEEVELVTVPELTIPDHLQILQETEYKFCLEKWVLTGVPDYPSDMQVTHGSEPSCPPYWLVFRSPQESQLARRGNSDLYDSSPRRRSHSLTAADARRLHPRVKFLISDSEGDEGDTEDDSSSSLEEDTPPPSQCGDRPPSSSLRRQFHGIKEYRPGSPCPALNPMSPLARHRRNSSSSLHDFRQSPPRTSSPKCQRHVKRRLPPLSHASRRRSLSPQPPSSSPASHFLEPRPSTAGHISSVRNHKPTVASLSPYSCLPPPPSVSQPLGSHMAALDSSAELLSALTQEERELLETITEHGYPLRSAIIALQKTGKQSPEQILSYLVTCDRLCERGYDAAEVEEALEMFHNCESKAAEFLRLLTQFNEMGFQQNAIKEVLLVHENHRERALEELMTRVA
ncbi:hypothetical protein MATL_G00139570 [Megalops atlanticus]|uniref:Ubiquitin-associated protein 1-like UBA2 domain-containing protein n=1 Tax=Megalops atlanticus TaxID=7932 RepID=A0A9D3T5U8_MEGAT|nr:hypothetical protein MATL_G00139570 [Megalops atlanticus]